ncbi:MAG: maltose ABC transporter permease MalF [Caldilineales bacterium]|nr:maltose ABC transporter permease MalF [Caldilineales bacterium]MDW8317738.1 maltose ABC transporter permease MalF [Anaerolineae bacterium]
MATASQAVKKSSAGLQWGGTTSSIVLRLVFVALFDAFAIFTGWQLIQGGVAPLAAVIWLIALGITIVFLRNDAMPLRWIMPGLAFMVLMHIYPVLFTVYTAFTNYSDGHLIPKPVAIQQIEKQTYLPADAKTFAWKVYSGPNDTFALWLTGQDGEQVFKTSTGEKYTAEDLKEQDVQFAEDGSPVAVGEFTPVPANQRFAILPKLQPLSFGPEEEAVRITSPTAAAQVRQKFVYDPVQDAMINQETGVVYANQRGTFTSPEGEALIPGFPVVVGLENFTRLLTSPALRGPLFTIFAWTVIFAFMSVLITFVLGLLLALVLNEPDLPLRRFTRVLMIVPYAIPAFISVLIWKGMFNPVIGIIGSQWDPGWFSSPFWAKVGILIVQLWLGYPYMFLITTGALQSIPGDLYEAAKVDGASGWQQFRSITLPLLLVAVGPLLIGSFAFNFNNFTIIQLYNNGGPPIPGTPTPAGYTDILISYTFKLAFGGGRGADLGLAAAISIVIFVIVGAITIFNFRYTGMLEEVSENV